MANAQIELEIDISAEEGNWPENLLSLADHAIRVALGAANPAIIGPLELSVLLTDDTHQQALNAQWRNKNSATNVLSFPQYEPFEPLSGLIGDISMAYETLEREAQDLGKSFDHHFTHLLIHGLLHIIGYDHETETDALVMEALETQILAGLDIADPYATN